MAAVFEVAMDEHYNTAFECLPDELIYQILSWLPVKIQIKFRSVCKSWYSLIADSSFIKLQLANHSGSGDNRYILATSGTNCYYKRPKSKNFVHCTLTSGKACYMQRSTMNLPFTPKGGLRGRIIIEGSCNGLICLRDLHEEFDQQLYLWNPCIRRLKLIRPYRDDHVHNSYYFCGIGFHQPSNNYIVVKLTYYYNVTSPQVDVYSLNADSWRTVNKFLPDRVYGSCSVSLNGYIYWLGTDAEDTILSFSTSGDDLFEQIMLPTCEEDAKGEGISHYIQVVKESLNLLIAPPYIGYDEVTDDVCDVWVMKEHGVFESWTKLFSVVINNGITKRVLRHVYFLHGLTVNGELLLGMLKNAKSLNEDLFLYDHKKFKSVDLQTQISFFRSSVISFKESLVLLDCPGTILMEI